MTNMLDGYEYRQATTDFNSWQPSKMAYGPWKDIPAGTDRLPSYIQLRVKRMRGYSVTEQGKLPQHFANEDAMLAEVLAITAKGTEVSVKKTDNILLDAVKHTLQFRFSDSRPTGTMLWETISRSEATVSFNKPTIFRIRPANFWRVSTDLAYHDFDDADTMMAHLNTKLRTEETDYKIARVKY